MTNFSSTLPAVHANLAQGLLKDPYLFDFLTLEETFHERELETDLLAHLQKFLLKLGRGFAFVGRQYRLAVSDREFYLHLRVPDIHKPIGIADYELTRALPKELASSLPSIEAIEAEFSRDLGTGDSKAGSFRPRFSEERVA